MLTAEELCDICGLTPNKRQAWAAEGDLRQRRGFEELDAVELAAYARLREAAGPKRGRAAWRQLRPQLARSLLNPPRGLWVVVEARGVPRHGLADTPSSLRRQVDHGRPVHVVEMRRFIGTVRASYRAAVQTKGPADRVMIRAIDRGQ